MAISVRRLQEMVQAAVDEIDSAIAFHEAWKPMAYDADLHARMGYSYAGHTFQTIRSALRREMLAAMMRIWDSHTSALHMKEISKALCSPDVLAELGNRFRDIQIGILNASTAQNDEGTKQAFQVMRESVTLELQKEMRQDLETKASAAVTDIKAYLNGEKNNILKDLVKFRHEWLAHRNSSEDRIGLQTDDAKVEEFFQDTLRIVSQLFSVVKGIAYDPAETAGMFEAYAKVFWAGVRSERVEGHPNFKPLRSLTD